MRRVQARLDGAVFVYPIQRTRQPLAMTLQADLSGLSLQRPRMLETTALGAAMLVGLGIRLWSSLEDLRRVYPLVRRFVPAQPTAMVDAARARCRELVKRA